MPWVCPSPTRRRVSVSGEGRGVRSSVCLGDLWLVDRTSSPLGSVLPGPPQSSMPVRTPQFSLLRKPSTVVVQVCCETVIWCHVGHVLVCLFLTLRLPSIETLHLYISEPLSAARGHNATRTAVIFICADSFIQALTAKHRMFTLLPVTRLHAHEIHVTGLVTDSAVIILVGSSSRSGYLNPGSVRWSPHLVPIVQTSL